MTASAVRGGARRPVASRPSGRANDEARRRGAAAPADATVPIARPAGELADLLHASDPKARLPDVALSAAARRSLDKVVAEYRQREELRRHGLSPRRKLLLVGPPGSGKTVTAAALAGELRLPLLAVRPDGLITKSLGETASEPRLAFDAVAATRGVYLFDEFDAVGADRARRDDAGEVRRALNSFLQFLEADDSDGPVLAATNREGLPDPALSRRSDGVVRYGLPDGGQAERLARSRLNAFDLGGVEWGEARAAAAGLSYAEVARACSEAAKAAVLGDRGDVTTKQSVAALRERSGMPSRTPPHAD